MKNLEKPIAIIIFDDKLLYRMWIICSHTIQKSESMDMELVTQNINKLFLTRLHLDGRPYSNQEVSDATGLGRATISRIRAGKEKNPSFRTIYKLARFFDVPTSYIVGDMPDSLQFEQHGEGAIVLDQIAYRSMGLDQRDLAIVQEMLTHILEIKQGIRKDQHDDSEEEE